MFGVGWAQVLLGTLIQEQINSKYQWQAVISRYSRNADHQTQDKCESKFDKQEYLINQ